MLNKLPKGWQWTKLSTIGEVVTGTTPRKNNRKYYGNDHPFFKPFDLNAGYYVKSSDDGLSDEGMRQARLLPEKSILVTCIGATIGKIGFNRVKGASNQQINAIVPADGIEPEFVYFNCISPDFQKSIINNASATTLPILNKSKFELLQFPLAPIPEQHRIVAKIEELFTRLDAGAEVLKQIKAQLKRYRQAVLKYAFEGKLTEEWRKKHKDEIASSESVLREQNRFFANAQNDNLYELPKGWVWTTVGQLYDIIGGGTPSTTVTKYWNGNIPWITSADIYGLKDIRPRKKISKEGIKNSATNLVPAGSIIVVTRVGLGKVSLTKTPICFSQDSQALVGNNRILSDYSLYYLSKAVQIFKYEHRGTTIAGVTKKQLAELLYPLPPLSEQHKIIEEIERRFSVADEVEKVVDSSLKQAERMRQSILKKAFEGKLVPQDPNDEPAEKLLERIREERRKKETNTKTYGKMRKRGRK